MANSAKDIIQGIICAKKEVTSNNIIRMHKGDSFYGTLYLNKGTLTDLIQYELTPNDTVYFGVFEVNHRFSNSIIKKIYSENSPTTENGDLIIELTPDDTAFLLPGTYYYSIKVVTTTVNDIFDPDTGETVEDIIEDVNTVIPKTLFYILE